MGLLDFMDNTDPAALTALAGGLLSGRGFAQSAVAGVGGYQQALLAAKQRALAEEELRSKMALQKAQTDDALSQSDQRKAAVQKAVALQAMTDGLLGGGSQTAGSGISLGGVTQAMPTRQPTLAGASIDDIARLKAFGGPDLLDLFKAAQSGVEMKPGSFYRKPGQSDEYISDPTKGVGFNNGVVSVMPGALGTQAALAGGLATATESAKAPYTIIKGYDSVKGAPIDTTVQILLDKLRGPQAQAAGGMQVQPALGQQARTQPQVLEQDLAMQQILSDMSKRGTSRANYELAQPGGGVSRGTIDVSKPSPTDSNLNGVQSGPGLSDKWEYDAKRGLMVNALGQTKPLVNQEGGQIGSPHNADQAMNSRQLMATMDTVKTLLGKDPTASGIGTAVDSAATLFGLTPKGAEAADGLRAASGWMTSHVPRMEGPQSDKDRQMYLEMAGKVGDSTLPVARRMAALQTVEELTKRYQHLNPAMAAVQDTAPSNRATVVRTGKDASGRRVSQMSDGSISYAD